MNNSSAVIIPVYKGEKWISTCLDSLKASIDSKHHIYVIDNHFNNSSIPNDIDFSNYSVLKTPHPMSFSEVNNFALAQMLHKHDYYCFLNQDTISTNGWLDICIDCMESNSTIGALMPFVTQYDGDGEDPAFKHCLSETISKLDISLKNGSSARINVVPQITGAAMVVRASALRDAGPFDPVYGSYCEDYDLGDRIKGYGYLLGICPSVTVAHFSGSASADKQALFRKSVLSIRNRALLKCRRRKKRRYSLVFALFLIDFPRRAISAVIKRPGAHCLASVIQSYIQLTLLLPRLISGKYDEYCFQKYLDKIGWNK